jgi:hypothetical protein
MIWNLDCNFSACSMVRRGLNCNDVKAADRRLARASFLLLLSLMAPSESDGQLTVRVRLMSARACHWQCTQLVHTGTVVHGGRPPRHIQVAITIICGIIAS